MTRIQTTLFIVAASALLLIVTFIQIHFGGSPFLTLSAALSGGVIAGTLLKRPS